MGLTSTPGKLGVHIMSVEDAIETIIGRFGIYQTWVLVLVLAARYPIDFQLTNVVFILPSVNYICLDDGVNNSTNYCPCENPLYETNDIVNSVTTEFNLICNKQSLASLSQSMLQVGILPGSLFFGFLSDRYGRKIAFITSQLCTVAFAAVSAAGNQLWMFMVCRCLLGIGVGGTMLCTYIYIIELSGKSFRPQATGLHEISYITGYFALAIIAYFVRDWRYLQLVTSVPWVFAVLYFWILPESPRWLITVGRKEEAIVLLTHIAKRNNRPTEEIKTIVQAIDSAPKEQRGSYIDLVRTPKVRLYTIINSLVWMFCAHTYFGINQFIGRLEGNIYLNVMLSAASLVPGLILIVLGASYLTRKVSVITCFCVVAVSLLLFIVIPSESRVLTLIFAMIGLTGAYCSFVLIYLFSVEVFPTVIRNSAIGVASVFGRFGSFIAPFVVNIGIEWVSILIFSCLALLAAIMCYYLPETQDTTLLNTIDQTEKRKDLPIDRPIR